VAHKLRGFRLVCHQKPPFTRGRL